VREDRRAFDVSKAMREGDPDRELSAEEWARALAPVRRAREQLLEATRSLSGQLVAETYMNRQRQQAAEIVRDLRDRLTQFTQLSEEARQSMIAASAVDAARAARPVREALALYDARAAEISRQVLEAMRVQAISVRTPRVQVSLPRPDFVVAEVPRRPMPSSESEVAAPLQEPTSRTSEQDLALLLAVGILTTVIGELLAQAILWYTQTGLWAFDALLEYLLQHVDKAELRPFQPPSENR
jgi:hypothetical protein